MNQETLQVIKVWEITSERHFINPSPLFEFFILEFYGWKRKNYNKLKWTRFYTETAISWEWEGNGGGREVGWDLLAVKSLNWNKKLRNGKLQRLFLSIIIWVVWVDPKQQNFKFSFLCQLIKLWNYIIHFTHQCQALSGIQETA